MSRATTTADKVTRSLIGRVIGFSVLPFLAALLPLVALPVVAHAASTAEWAGLNIGLGVGGFTAAVGLVGWNVLGTPLVAMTTDPAERLALYGRSFYIRLLAVGATSVVGAAVAAAIAPDGTKPLAAVFAISGGLTAIGLSWYAVGVAAPRLVFWYEVVPRSVATALSIAVVLLTGQILWYGLLLCLSAIVGTLWFHVRHLGRLLPAWPGAARLREDIGDMSSSWGVESVGSLYANAPVPIAGVIGSTSATAAYSSSHQIFRYGLLAVSAAGNALQAWVLETEGTHRRRRHQVAFVVMGAVALVGWVVLAVLGPVLSGLLFAGKQGEPAVFHAYAIAFVAVALSTPLIRNILIPHRRDRQVLVVTIVSALLGLTAMFVLGNAIGPLGVAVGFALSEVFTLVACTVLAVRHARRRASEVAHDEDERPEVHIVLLAIAWTPVGGYKVAYEYANALVAQGVPVTVWHSESLHAFQGGRRRLWAAVRGWLAWWLLDHRGQWARGGVSWFPVDPRVRLRATSWFPRIPARVGDVILATAAQTAPFAARVAARSRARTAVLIQHHETWAETPDHIAAGWAAMDERIVIAPWLADLCAGRGLTTHLLPNALVPEAFPLGPALDQRSAQVVSLLSPHGYKRADVVIGVLEEVLRRRPDVIVETFGQSPERPAMAERIRYTPDPSPERLRALYQGSQVYLCGSDEEGWHLPPAEATLCGAAVVSTDIGGVRASMADDALYAQRGDVAALADRVVEALSDLAAAQRRVDAARARLLEVTYEANARRLREILRV
ncbi:MULTISPECIES: glycosyltransferase [unclassified Microbacterium]|uniref:glycosyltransferase n=1 Tax=unclassified Microbacterium TaxID=2609290 RepID=UPI003010164C